MMGRLHIGTTGFVAVLVMSTMLFGNMSRAADPPSAELCMGSVERHMLDHVDMWRAVVYGARALPRGGHALITGPIVSPVVSAFIAARPSPYGILETKGRLTSELIEPILQSYRVLGCELQSVCAIAAASIESTGGQITVRPLGCASMTEPLYNECFIASTATPTTTAGSVIDRQSINGDCQTLVERTLAMEAAILKGAVAYDAGYRASLQSAGIFDWLMQDTSSSAIAPIRDLVGLLGKLHEIPCFAGQCDAPDTSSLGRP